MRREYRGRQRNNNTKSFPYEPLVVGGRLVMPVELQRVHRAVLGGLKSPRTCVLWWRGAGPNWSLNYQHAQGDGVA